MWGWQSLDRQTLAWYEPYENGFGMKGWVSDAIAPGIFFGVARLHKTEEEADSRVQAFYQSYLTLQEKKRRSKMPKLGRLYPFGYTPKDAMEQLDTLMLHEDTRLFDIRYSAWSRYRPEWRKDSLEAKYAYRYQHIRDLGNIAYKNRDIEPIKLANPELGIPYLVSYLEAGYDVIILCACKQYETCHRKVVTELVRQALPEVEVSL